MSLSRQKLTLIGIFALFMGPVILVMLMRSSWWQYQPAGMQNQGYLVQPPTALALTKTMGSDGKWVILYVPRQPCDQACLEHAAALRQIHMASGRHREHLAVALLSESPLDPGLRAMLEAVYPDFVLLTEPAPEVWGTLAAVNASVAADSSETGRIHSYVLDPMHNVILAYPASVNPGGIHKDLKRLLKLSEQEKAR
jgi:hypothetical protein